jgi:DNA invertase Pin-like site-specific DNA recombinase
MGEIIGYARVSSIGQSLDIQLDKLKHCDRIYQEKASGKVDSRPELKECLSYIRAGDTLVISRLDRLARSTLHLCQIAELLRTKEVALQVLDQSIDTSTAAGKLMFNVLGAIAEFETEIRAERQRDGINKAREQGIQLGRKNSLTPSQVLELRERRDSGELIKDLMREFRLSKATIYRYLETTGQNSL